MEKIWIITVDEVIDYEDSQIPPVAFKNESDARKEFERLKNEIKEEYAEDIEEEYVSCNEDENWIDIYGDSYAEEHYFAKLYCVELQ